MTRGSAYSLRSTAIEVNWDVIGLSAFEGKTTNRIKADLTLLFTSKSTIYSAVTPHVSLEIHGKTV